MESVIVKTGILKLADRGTKTNKPFIKKEKNSSSVKASSKNIKGGKVGEGGHTGPDDKVFKSDHYLREVAFCILHLHFPSGFQDGCKVAIAFEVGLTFEFGIAFALELGCRFRLEVEFADEAKFQFGFQVEVELTFAFAFEFDSGSESSNKLKCRFGFKFEVAFVFIPNFNFDWN